MKTKSPSSTKRTKLIRSIAALFVGASLLTQLGTPTARAAVYYWDDNAAAAGFGTAGASTGTWAGPTAGPTAGWSLSSTGANAFAPFTTAASGTADGLNFGTATDGLGLGSISVSGTVSANSITYGSASGAITLTGGTQITMGGTTPTIAVNNTTNTISTKIAGTAGLLKNGAGELVLSGTGNSFSGLIQAGSALAIRVSAGTLTVSGGTTATTANGLGSYSADSGTFKQTGGTVSLAADLIVGWNSSPTFTLSGGTLSAANIRHQDAGTAVVTISGAASVTAPNVFNTSAGGGTDSLTVNLDGGTLTATRMYVNAITATTGSHALNINLNGGTLKSSATGNLIDVPTGSNAANASVNATVKIGGAIFDTNGFTATILRPLLHDSGLGATADGGVTKNGTGTLALTNNNTYTGVTNINVGIVAISHANALGTTAGNTTIAATGNLTTGGQLSLSGGITSPENITITGATELSGFNAAILNTSGSNNALSGNITLSSTTGAIRIGAANGSTLTLSGNISQTGSTNGLAFQASGTGSSILVSNPIANNGGGLFIYGTSSTGTGAVTLSGVSGSGIGNTNIQQTGTLKLGVTDALNTTGNLSLGVASTTAGNDIATFDLAGFNQTVNALNGIVNTSNAAANTLRRVTNSAAGTGTNILTVGNGGGSGTFNGVIVDGATAKVAFIKIGSGTETLAGVNTYTGTTTVNGGTLAVTATGSLPSNSPANVFVAAPDSIQDASDPKILRNVASGTNYATAFPSGFGSTSVSAAPLTTGTTASILAGTSSASANVGMQWRTRLAPSETDGSDPNTPLSDVVNLTGMPTDDVYLMQMSYSQAALTALNLDETAIATSGELRLGWYNTNTDTWETATDGNTSGSSHFVGPISAADFLSTMTGSLTDNLGAYGVDYTAGSGGTVWAILNHNSEFAVIPEPSTFVLGALGVLGLGIIRMRRRKSA